MLKNYTCSIISSKPIQLKRNFLRINMSESGLSSISSGIIRSVLSEVIETELRSKDYTIEIKSASQAGSTNFIGIVSRVLFKTTNEVKNEEGSLILKSAPENLARREQFHTKPCFIREIYMYNEILPYFRCFEQSKGISVEDKAFTEYPKCFGTVDVELNECILLEDLKIRGFIPIDRHTEELNVHHIRLFLQAIAKYHAISMALKDQQPKKFRTLTSNLNDVILHRQNEHIRKYFEMQAQYTLSLFSADKEAHLLKKLKQFFNKDVLDVCVDGIELETSHPTAIVSYGDVNLNNSLFRYNDNREPIEISLLDWQASRLALPIADIIQYLFMNVTKEVRDAHYDDLLKEYHRSLTAHIQRLGSDIEDLYPYEVMQEQLKNYGKQGIIFAFFVLPILTSEPGGGVDLDELSKNIANGNDTLTSVVNNLSSEFNKRMRDVVIDMDRLGYI